MWSRALTHTEMQTFINITRVPRVTWGRNSPRPWIRIAVYDFTGGSMANSIAGSSLGSFVPMLYSSLEHRVCFWIGGHQLHGSGRRGGQPVVARREAYLGSRLKSATTTGGMGSTSFTFCYNWYAPVNANVTTVGLSISTIFDPTKHTAWNAGHGSAASLYASNNNGTLFAYPPTGPVAVAYLANQWNRFCVAVSEGVPGRTPPIPVVTIFVNGALALNYSTLNSYPVLISCPSWTMPTCSCRQPAWAWIASASTGRCLPPANAPASTPLSSRPPCGTHGSFHFRPPCLLHLPFARLFADFSLRTFLSATHPMRPVHRLLPRLSVTPSSRARLYPVHGHALPLCPSVHATFSTSICHAVATPQLRAVITPFVHSECSPFRPAVFLWPRCRPLFLEVASSTAMPSAVPSSGPSVAPRPPRLCSASFRPVRAPSFHGDAVPGTLGRPERRAVHRHTPRPDRPPCPRRWKGRRPTPPARRRPHLCPVIPTQAPTFLPPSRSGCRRRTTASPSSVCHRGLVRLCQRGADLPVPPADGNTSTARS